MVKKSSYLPTGPHPYSQLHLPSGRCWRGSACRWRGHPRTPDSVTPKASQRSFLKESVQLHQTIQETQFSQETV